MKNRMLSWGLILSLLLTMLPVSAMAAEDELAGDGLSVMESTQCTCGAEPNAAGVTVHQEGCPLYEAPAVEEPPTEEPGLDASGFSSMGEPALLAGTGEHGTHTGWTPLKSSTQTITNGNYYLSSTVATNSNITVSGNVTLCLNSNTLNIGQNTTFTVSSGATLTICDCQSGGTITGTESYINLNVISVTGGTLNLESGTISGTTTRSGSLISVTGGGTLNVTGGTISLNHTSSDAYDGVQAVKLSEDSTGSFTGGKVSLTTAVENDRATTVYQEGGSVTVGGSAALSFESENALTAPGYGALCVTQNGAVTVEDNCTITASRTGGEMAGAVSIGKMISANNYEVGTATITGGDINGFLVVYGEATIYNGSFAYIENRGTLTMTGGTVKNENENGINYGIWTSVTDGETDLSNVTIKSATGIYVNTGQPPTIREDVTITATKYGVDGSATLVGAPSISGGIADLYIYSMRTTTDYPSVDATAYTGGALTVQERKFPDAHQGGYIGCAIQVPQENQSLFSLTNSDGNFVYQYDTENSALRLYNTKSHPICGASCSHGDDSHSNPAWQQWSTPSGYTLTGGSYYLTSNVTLSQPITITGNVNFCLNGNTIKTSVSSGSPFQVQDGGSLTICDCEHTGQLTGGIAATGGQISIYGGTISGGAYAVDLGGNAKLTLAGSPDLSGTKAALKLYTKSGTTLENAAVDATAYTGGSLTVEEDNVPDGANGFAIQGGKDKFSLKNPSGGYHYAYEGGYVIRPDHTHSYTYSGSGAVITETCTCGHRAKATISIQDGAKLTYTGSAIEPAEVTYSEDWQGGYLTPDYENNVNAGTAKATIKKDDAEASVTFTIKKANQTEPTASDYTIDYPSETITYIASGCKVYTAEDASIEVQTGEPVTPGTTYYIRREEDANHNPSDFTSFTVTARPAAPSVIAVAETIKGKRDGKVTGVNDTMEYSTDGGQNWQGCTGNEITGLAADTVVMVRIKATSTTPHSETASCTIPEGTTTLTVKFEENGGSTVVDIDGLSYDVSISEPIAPTKTGYTFAGWYKDENYATQWNFSSDKVTDDITLYAKWTLKTPSVTITGAPEEPVTYGTSVTLTASVTHDIPNLDYTYTWYKDDTELTDQTKSTLVLSAVADSGEYKVKVTASDGSQSSTASSAPMEVEIKPLGIAVTWSGLMRGYGESSSVNAVLDGVLENDVCTLSAITYEQGDTPVTAPTNAGEYTAEVSLTGADAANYTLKNGTETLTIRPKTVGFTVTDNAVQGGDTAKTATVTPTDNALTQDGYMVTYRQGTTTVATPTAVGSYEIWVEITNGNYRHTNGTTQMQVGTLTITEAPPVLYDVTFAKGGEDVTGTAPEALSAVADAKIILPESTFTRTNYQFSGWSYSGKTYQPGDSFTLPAQDVTFTAQWQHTYGITVTVREPEGEDMQPVSDAVVSLWLGANKLDERNTGNDGTCTFTDLLPGIYNLVVTKGDRIVTSMVEITTENVEQDADLPKGATNSIVEVTEGSPDIVVGNLETVFDKTDDTVYTKADQATVIGGGKVEFTFKADEKQKTEVSGDLQKIQEVSGDSNLALVMDYKLEKEVFDAEGTKIEDASKPITESNVLLEIRLPLPVELQGKASYSVYRVHDNKAEAMKANPGSNEEGFHVENNDMIIYAKKFSTYAIGYAESSGNNNNNNNQTSGGGGSSATTYPPTIVQPEHGSVTISPKKPGKGDQVTITPTPDDGYAVDTVIVTGPDGKEVAVTPNDDGTYTFVQPSGKVTITVTFRQLASVSDCPRDESCPMAPFTDADRNAWYHDGVHYCVEHGLMMGTSQTTFAPNTVTTRGMIVTILWRLEGSPIVGASLDYDDVKAEDWYGEAIRWADSVGVVTGYGNGKFGPNDTITREQMAAMLWRYAGSPRVDGSLSSFTDGAQTSSWAQPAMIWAVEQGLITGVGNDRLEPRGQATRAQAATILMQFVQNMAQ